MEEKGSIWTSEVRKGKYRRANCGIKKAREREKREVNEEWKGRMLDNFRQHKKMF